MRSVMQPAPAKQKSFLSHVNGLRALAILGILIYHLNAAYCPAGYFGVDVFLVISGYFLLASLMKAEKPGDIHYGSFLLKKSWRILPPWLVVTLVFCFGSVWFMIPTDRIDICCTAARSAFFGADFYIDHLYDYFNQKAHTNLFLHYWYLSITCQMYIIIPLLVMLLLWLTTKRKAAMVLGGIGMLSFVYYILTTTPQVPEGFRTALLKSMGMETAYYHLLPRLWEVLLGGAALLLPAWQDKRGLRMLLETVGILAIVVSAFLCATGSPMVYPAAFGALLFLRYGGDGPVSRLLSWRPVQWLGTISFSLYLWHWPIMAGWKYSCLDGVTACDEWVMLGLSLVLGALGWALVERLKMPKPTTRLSSCLRFLPLVLLICFGVGISPYYRSIRTQVGQLLKGHGTIKELYAAADKQPEDEALHKDFPRELFEDYPVYIGTDESELPSFIYMGDSHSVHSSYGMHRYLQEHGGRGILLNNSVVPFWWCIKERFGVWNENKADKLVHYMQQQPGLKYVFIALLWETRLYARTLSDNNGYPTRDWRNPTAVLDIDAQIALREEGLRETCRRFKEMGYKVVLVADVPFLPHKMSPYEEWLKVKMLTGREAEEYLTPVAEHEKKSGACMRLFEKLVQEGVAWAAIDSAEAMRQGDYYRTRNDKGEFLYSDNNHITFAGSELVGGYVMAEWKRLMREEEEKQRAEAPAATAE